MNSRTIEKFEVKLQDVNKVFCPGDTIYGQVNLKVKEDLKIKEMRLECRGEAYVNWPEYSGSYTRYHYNRERYFNAIEVIFGEEKEKENGVKSSACISQGCYSFSFKFIIPDKYLPTSFEGRHGNIRYWVRAVIDRGLGKSNVKTKPAPFMIGDYVALEDFENVSEALVEEEIKKTGMSCFRSGTLVLRAETDRGGFKEGDVIHVSVLVTNETPYNVACIEVSLVQRSLFVDIGGGKTFSDHTICDVRKQGVLKGWEQEFPKISLAIPSTTYPTLISCKCIAVLYFIQITAKFKGKLTKNGYLEMPVVIASSDDETVIEAQKNAQKKPASLRPLRRRGTFFCVTAQNTLLYKQDNSNMDFSDQEEVDDFIASHLSRTKQSGYNFTANSNKSLPRKQNHSSAFASRHEPERKFVNSNGQFKLISAV